MTLVLTIFTHHYVVTITIYQMGQFRRREKTKMLKIHTFAWLGYVRTQFQQSQVIWYLFPRHC